MMNGKIWVDSKLGVGSKFTFVITLKESQIDEKCPYCGKFTNSSIGLVVEDNILKEILNYYLEPTGCKQYIYSSIEEFNEASRTDNYDIVFIEDNLLDSSKNSEIDIVKKTKQEKNIKFVVITTRLYLNTKTGNIYKDLFDDNLSRTIKKSKLFTIIDKFIDMASRNDRRGQETSKTIETSQQVINKLHILVAEDNETNQKLLKIILTKLGHTFDIAIDGQEAIDMAMANRYDIILMDIQMPNVNGYEATSHLREAGLTIPIIAVSANAFQEDVENSINSGMNGHITKPYVKEEIEEVLNYYSFEAHNPKQNVIKNSEDTELFNYEELLVNFEDEKEIVKEVLELFIKKVENQIVVIEDASKNGDYEKIKFESHSIKGGSFNITAKRLGSIAEKIELSAKINNTSETKSNITHLKDEFIKVKEIILKFL